MIHTMKQYVQTFVQLLKKKYEHEASKALFVDNNKIFAMKALHPCIQYTPKKANC